MENMWGPGWLEGSSRKWSPVPHSAGAETMSLRVAIWRAGAENVEEYLAMCEEHGRRAWGID